ncbi:MAG: LysR substrate-binding domain-containing protein [Candidatus Binataceae bacterium]
MRAASARQPRSGSSDAGRAIEQRRGPSFNRSTGAVLPLAKRLAIGGHGITVAPRWSVRGEIERGELRAIPLGPAGVFRQWCMAYHHGAELTGIRRTFLRTCQEELPRLLGTTTLKRRPPREQTPETRASDTSEDDTATRLGSAITR